MEDPLHYGGPFPPLGYDSGFAGLLEDNPFTQPVDEFGFPIIMTQLPFNAYGGYYNPDMTYEATGQQAEVAAQQEPYSGTEGSISLSPDDASGHILTPSSSNYSPYIADFEDSDVVSGSPASDRSIEADYVRVPNPNRSHEHSQSMNQAPRSSPRPAPSAQNLSRSRNGSQQPSNANQAMAPSSGWASFGSSSGASMDDLTATTYDSFVGSGDFTLYDENVLANMGNMPSAFTTAPPPSHQQPMFANLPFRGQDGVPNLSNQLSHQDQSLAAFQFMNNAATYATTQGQLQYAMPNTTANATLSSNTSQFPRNSPLNTHPHQHQQNLSTTPQVPQIVVPSSSSNRMPRRTANTSSQPGPSARAPAASRTHGSSRPRVQVRTAPQNSSDSSPQQYEPFDFSGAYPAIAAADPTRSRSTAQSVSAADKISKGGRKKNSHLPVVSRERSHAMRKVGACWRCVLQRDPCDAPEGGCCSRCVMRANRGQTYYFECDRSKLPDFVHVFLPESLLLDHQKRNIESFVQREVVQWHVDNCIDVYLHSGYGPALHWRLYEFTPKNLEFLYQMQAYQDPQSRRSLTSQKYSPPYGLMRIDSVDDRNYEAYLEDLLSPQWLSTLGESAYAEENIVDDEMFQCKVLDLMCSLYVGTEDQTLKPLLGDVLRMIIITYIMGHTLTITEDTTAAVINNLRHSPKPPAIQKFTSPRLANRQLKFFFHIVRNSIYEKLLKWLQHTLHTGGKKQETWLHSFCVTLGFAMVLEEVQRTMQCQAEAKICRKEATPQAAFDEAYGHCENIDKRFKLLIGLFQCKYRDRKWANHGSFGNGTPEFRDPVASDFLQTLRDLVEQREDHLRQRENVQFSLENQCFYTTRLTARFLLPFLNLPPA